MKNTFLNPDGTLALVVANQARREQRLTIDLSDDARAAALLPARTVGTYVWAVR